MFAILIHLLLIIRFQLFDLILFSTFPVNSQYADCHTLLIGPEKCLQFRQCLCQRLCLFNIQTF